MDTPSPFNDDAERVAAAIKAANGAAELARKLGITRWAPHQWKRIPADRVAQVAEITGIPAHLLRPDVFTAPCHAQEHA
jgi:hypothetical protein